MHSWNMNKKIWLTLRFLYTVIDWHFKPYFGKNPWNNLEWLVHTCMSKQLHIKTLDKQTALPLYCMDKEFCCYISFTNHYYTYPGTPPDSKWLAIVTSSDQTSYCHLHNPRTPLRTIPLWTPILISTSTPVASRTSLQNST